MDYERYKFKPISPLKSNHDQSKRQNLKHRNGITFDKTAAMNYKTHSSPAIQETTLNQRNRNRNRNETERSKSDGFLRSEWNGNNIPDDIHNEWKGKSEWTSFIEKPNDIKINEINSTNVTEDVISNEIISTEDDLEDEDVIDGQCSFPGCQMMLKGWKGLPNKLRRHYCGSCHLMYCVEHTKIATHSIMTACDMQSECVCVSCFPGLPPKAQAILLAKNKLQSKHGD